MKEFTLVLGASLKEVRYSNLVINKLLAKNIKVKAIGFNAGMVNGVTIQTKMLKDDTIDTITLYLGAKNQKQYYDYILELNPNRVIFNPGTENPELYELLTQANIKFEIACTLVLLSTNQY
ncbi:MAG: CoA-binding protein [Bacteroidetes bacterium MedPE-SWsnd-G2]|nr:MAG: CoA-binding protein [Bacteroidetes bacterium MedPE-SWsnd-G2]